VGRQTTDLVAELGVLHSVVLWGVTALRVLHVVIDLHPTDQYARNVSEYVQ
jgi:hypothetical protein